MAKKRRSPSSAADRAEINALRLQEIVHVRVIGILVEQLGGRAFIPDSVLASADGVLTTTRDEETQGLPGWRFSVQSQKKSAGFPPADDIEASEAANTTEDTA